MKYQNIFFIIFALLFNSSIASESDTMSEETINMIIDDMEGQPQKEIFKTFHYLHLKDYELNSEEGLQRYRIFKTNLNWIKEQNSQLPKKIYGITQFTDLTQEEFNEKHLTKPEQIQEWINQTTKQSVRNLRQVDHHDDHHDHHDHHHDHHDHHHEVRKDDNHDDNHDNYPVKNNKVDDKENEEFNKNLESAGVNWMKFDGPVKAQMNCGSCWAFTAIAAIENRYHQLVGKYTSFSEQYLINCDNLDSGCKGGWPSKTFTWIKNNGVVASDRLPYIGKTGICDTDLKRFHFNIVDGYKLYLLGQPKISYTKTWRELQKDGPLIVGIDARFLGFKQYRPTTFDVIEPINCVHITHVLLAVGIVNENGEDMIILRNSWGKTWGYEGYVKIPEKNCCLITNFGFLPIVKKGKVPVPNPPKPKPAPSDCVEVFGWYGFTKKAKGTFCDSKGRTKFGAFYGVKFPETQISKKPLVLRLYKKSNCFGDYMGITESTEYPKKNGKIQHAFSLAFMKPVEEYCANFYKHVCLIKEPLFSVCEDIPDTSVINLDELASILSINADSENIAQITFHTGRNFKGKKLVLDVSDGAVTNIWIKYKIKYYARWKIIRSIKLVPRQSKKL